MKKQLTFILLSVVLTMNIAKAQDLSYDKGTLVITAGLGFPDLDRGTLKTYYSGHSSYKVTGFGPLLLKGDYGIYKFKWGHTVGAGMVLGFNTTKAQFTYRDWSNNGNGIGGYWQDYTQTDKYTTITIGARGTYHFFTKEKFDCYASIGLGFNINTHNQTTTDPGGVQYRVNQRPGLYEAGTVGIRYFFTKNFGVYSELGWDNSAPIQAGISLKF